ncbi:hypothetical protein FGO68_gene17260 [Halteria grandinella]|uniref:Uncharacterized protein n=1 Tax=Halteria grandinella TaxID=5974 RepID=A0A8J8NK74_HALGN|nr:hypothetical protein FGO68_gene17260 [Halteria grandinella]
MKIAKETDLDQKKVYKYFFDMMKSANKKSKSIDNQLKGYAELKDIMKSMGIYGYAKQRAQELLSELMPQNQIVSPIQYESPKFAEADNIFMIRDENIFNQPFTLGNDEFAGGETLGDGNDFDLDRMFA